MSQLKLRIQVEGNTEGTVLIEDNPFVLGRSPDCNLCLPFFGVSRHHGQIVTRGNGWLIEDLGSLNGTLLNGLPATSAQWIHHGDVVQIGVVSLVVLILQPPGDEQPKVPELSTDGTTILRNVKDLQRLWLQPQNDQDTASSNRKAIARLKDLVDISKGLNFAGSLEAIFLQVQEAVFRDLKRIDRIALLIDLENTGRLKIVRLATRHQSDDPLTADGSWISHSICQKVFLERVAIQTADAQADERFEGEMSILSKGIRSVMAVPLWEEEQVFGVLYADAYVSTQYTTLEAEEDLSFFSALANLVASSVQRWLLEQKLRDQENIRQRLERYHTPSVVQQMMAAGALTDGRLPLAEYEISILFADIVGFTALSERLDPSEIAELLNNFFEEMLHEVFVAKGTLDKFIGDCIMAFFGAPEVQTDHADRAVAAARGMLTRLEHLNKNNRWNEPLELRIAINSGKAVVGDIGSSQRVDYTVLGSTINLASRMEGICPPGECVVSETTYKLLRVRRGFMPMGSYRFRGIERPIKVYQTTRTIPEGTETQTTHIQEE
ncbi:adenylate/guanylate cyclase domain-containing protein [Roseofilum sp. BLCC_M91]|uniref:Adenylate/guanylate cyclase domain-containing protein n=1 Tax=Roseofilum halophilum BLCC-M91 TaxID=3022259 RepID=A0ABT7BEY1_9CYAN|nr:adenylate/guanylate cyclase domain-containing protein [Roseofilum halophilum]MDJ1177738.1 adenylate/guanylate cyclase domain-containing protein [Roseofilum halophilum BLCC-M91]